VGGDMTANGLFGDLAAWTGLAAPSPASTKPMMTSGSAGALAQGDSDGERVKVGAILNVSDRVLGETSSRRHVFDWLAPGGHPLPVDAYYPGQKLVVLCEQQPEAHRALCGELVAAHGLRLFQVDLAGYQADPGQAFSRLIGELRRIDNGSSAASATLAAPAPAPAFPPAPAPEPPLPTPPDFFSALTQPFSAPAPPFPDATQPLPAPPPPVAPPRQSVSAAFQPFMAAVQRLTAAPEPFVVPPEPADAATQPSDGTQPTQPLVAPQPAFVAPQPAFVAPQPAFVAPQPAFVAPQPTAPSPAAVPQPPPASPGPFAASLRPVPVALQPFLPAPPPPPLPQASSWPTEPPTVAAPAETPYPSAPQPFGAAPLPFGLIAPPPLPPNLAALVAEPERNAKRPRVGQRQAEAAARAARFVDARAAGSRSRVPAPQSIRPLSVARPIPPSRPVQWWNGAMGTPAAPPFTVAVEPALDVDGYAISPSTTRAEAIERALARGRAIPDPHRPSPTESTRVEPVPVEPDEIMLGFVVACIVVVELYIGVALFTFGGGPVVLGLGLAFDAAARALGTVAATRSGQGWGTGWRWLCGIGGSPAVAAFTFQRDGSLLATDLAPLAGPMAVVALILILIGLAGIPAGI
jgi:hypothetical protein